MDWRIFSSSATADDIADELLRENEVAKRERRREKRNSGPGLSKEEMIPATAENPLKSRYFRVLGDLRFFTTDSTSAFTVEQRTAAYS
jgi:hypothetical protein